jgi:hypothetical protein
MIEKHAKNQTNLTEVLQQVKIAQQRIMSENLCKEEVGVMALFDWWVLTPLVFAHNRGQST